MLVQVLHEGEHSSQVPSSFSKNLELHTHLGNSLFSPIQESQKPKEVHKQLSYLHFKHSPVDGLSKYPLPQLQLGVPVLDSSLHEVQLS